LESFVKTYFKKLQETVSGITENAGAANKKPATGKAALAKMAEIKATKASASMQVPGVKRITNIDMIVELIQGSAEGISTSELKEKAGLSELQIWNIVNRASKLGKIKKVNRGVYGAAQIQ
jgi:hypothetical protein